jgi:3-methylfumaryl-CoA hydratase
MADDFSQWVGNTETRTDILEPARSNALGAALGYGEPIAAGDPMPLLHHWLYFWDVRSAEALGTDGHPARGGFLPPVPLPRRMWASGRLRFHAPLLLGEQVTKTSNILKVEAKSGKSGELVFVTVAHELSGRAGLAISEEQDIVYREAATAPISLPSGADAKPESRWHRAWMPDALLLFRYSALTMNGHRIHYDRPYAMDEEAYPALVVHGPLQATLLAAMAQDNLGKPLSTFDFRGQSPAFDGSILHICGDPTEDGASLRSVQNGATCMSATAT